ncbi:hypothetical protein [Paenibacillus sanfengchensis]|uniref:hypothetical protein n=1 Tax=Paenibacillus TaxID=44249 RepID=UPI003A5C1695
MPGRHQINGRYSRYWAASFVNRSSLRQTSGSDVSGTNVWWKNNKSVNAKGLAASEADFVSLTPTLTRNSNGSPNLGSFLKLSEGSDLAGAGTPSGANIWGTLKHTKAILAFQSERIPDGMAGDPLAVPFFCFTGTKRV